MRYSVIIMSTTMDDEHVQARIDELEYPVSGSARRVATCPMDPRDAD